MMEVALSESPLMESKYVDIWITKYNVYTANWLAILLQVQTTEFQRGQEDWLEKLSPMPSWSKNSTINNQ